MTTSEDFADLPIEQARRAFCSELTRAVHDPSRTGVPGSPAEMLRNLAAVVLDAHELTPDGFCGRCSRVDQGVISSPKWPCDEIIRMGRIYGIWWSRRHR